MNTINVHEISPETRLMSVDDTAAYLNIFYPELVDQILEAFTDYTDVDIIQEIVDTLNLDVTCVTEHSSVDLLIHGYVHGGVNV